MYRVIRFPYVPIPEYLISAMVYGIIDPTNPPLNGVLTMNSKQIEFFLSAAKHLSFTKAADEFYTSQPTVSRQVALLENELGFELFKRDRSNLRLTVGGAIMAQEFARSNQIIHDAVMRVELVSDGLEGEISIGYPSGLNTDLYVYPPTFEFTREYPAIKVDTEAVSFSGLRKNLDSGEFDIIFTFNFELPAIQNSLSMSCYSVTPIIVMSSTHPLAAKDNIKTQDFSGQTFILPSSVETHTGRSDILNILKELNISDVKLRSATGNESRLFGVRSGVGVAILDTSMELVFDSRYRYFELPKEYAFSTLHILAVWKKDNLNPIIPIYLEVLRESLKIGAKD